MCFDATLSLERRPWNAAEIRRALVRYPAMTATVVAGIHLAGAEVVVEGSAGGAGASRATAWANVRPTRPRRPTGPIR